MPLLSGQRTPNPAKLAAPVDTNNPPTAQIQTPKIGDGTNVATGAGAEKKPDLIWRPMTMARPLMNVSDLVGVVVEHSPSSFGVSSSVDLSVGDILDSRGFYGRVNLIAAPAFPRAHVCLRYEHSLAAIIVCTGYKRQ